MTTVERIARSIRRLVTLGVVVLVVMAGGIALRSATVSTDRPASNSDAPAPAACQSAFGARAAMALTGSSAEPPATQLLQEKAYVACLGGLGEVAGGG